LAVEDIQLTVNAARKAMKVDASRTPSLDQCLNLLITGPFLAQIYEALRKHSPSEQPWKEVTPEELNIFLNVLFLLHRTGASPSDFFSELKRGKKSQFGEYPELVGAEEIYGRCMSGLSYSEHAHDGMTWAESQNFDRTLHDAATALWTNASSIFFHPSVTIVSLDDDQLRLRSMILALLGITRKHNPAKCYGPVQDVVCSFGTGAAIAGHLASSRETSSDSFAACIGLISDPHGGCVSNHFSADRGYSNLTNVGASADVGFKHSGCITKTASQQRGT